MVMCPSLLLFLSASSALSGGKPWPTRRDFLTTTSSSFAVVLVTKYPANAATDCFTDCVKNCKLIAPKDPEYCFATCSEYCSQSDRRDGLSGSVSSEGGETGIFGTNTVVKGEDKPPQLKIPGLDFTSDTGKKLIGY